MTKKKILIVDDEPNIVMSLEYAFKKKKFKVFIARDGSEAIDIAHQQLPDAIVLDIMMPKMDGYETISILKKNENLNHTKMVFLSAKNKEVDKQKGLDLGADLYLTKPFSVKKVISQIEQLINLS